MPACTKCEFLYPEDELMCGELCWDCATRVMEDMHGKLIAADKAIFKLADTYCDDDCPFCPITERCMGNSTGDKERTQMFIEWAKETD